MAVEGNKINTGIHKTESREQKMDRNMVLKRKQEKLQEQKGISQTPGED